jgi:ADP-ribose pyrophosphatase YjhB (NUDIX family)
MTEPDWLVWGREIQAIAQSGLTYTENPYDQERYAQLRALAARIMAAHSGTDARRIEALFAAQSGYATPKIGVRGAAFRDGRILMVREAQDGGWTLPGGWADVNLTLAESTAKEMVEESGFSVRVTKLVAAWDRSRQGHVPPLPFSTAQLFFLCDITGGAPRTSLETSEIGFFAEHEIPKDLSLARVLPHQIARMFAHHADPALPTEFE